MTMRQPKSRKDRPLTLPESNLLCKQETSQGLRMCGMYRLRIQPNSMHYGCLLRSSPSKHQYSRADFLIMYVTERSAKTMLSACSLGGGLLRCALNDMSGTDVRKRELDGTCSPVSIQFSGDLSQCSYFVEEPMASIRHPCESRGPVLGNRTRFLSSHE